MINRSLGMHTLYIDTDAIIAVDAFGSSKQIIHRENV